RSGQRSPATTAVVTTPASMGTPNAAPTVLAASGIPTPAETPETVNPTEVAVAAPPTPKEAPVPIATVRPPVETTSMVVKSPVPIPSSATARTPVPMVGDKALLRSAAEAARDRSAQARGRAEAAEAPRFAAANYDGGRAQEEVAAKLLSRGDFRGARIAFD